MTGEPKKLSEELDEATLAIILRQQIYHDSCGAVGACECCGVSMNGSAYDVLRQGERRCQVCKILGERRDKFQTGRD